VIVITVEYEKDMPTDKVALLRPAWVKMDLANTQTARTWTVALRPGERVQHRLRLDPAGVIKLDLSGVDAVSSTAL
jgi:hypothetical protein